MARGLSEDTRAALKREVDQMFVNLHHALRGDDPPCPDCDWMEKVRLGAWKIRGLIEHDPSNDPADYIGSNARWNMHVKAVLAGIGEVEDSLVAAEAEHAAGGGVILPWGDFNRIFDEAKAARENLEAAVSESEESADYCDTGAEETPGVD